MRTMPTPTPRRAPSGKTPSRGPRAAAGRAVRAVGTFMARRPGVILAVTAIVGGGGVFSWNALTQQPTKHPAPLFASKPDPGRVEPPRRPETAALPQPKPKPEAAATAMPTTAAGTSDTQARNAAADPIGALIRSSEGPARIGEPAKAEAARIAAVQKALTKIGYGPLKPDGIMGLTTKQAVEKFERDRNLPVSGGLAPRTTKQLAAASGLPVE